MTHETRYFIEYRICGKFRLKIIELKRELLKQFPEIDEYDEAHIHITLIPPINGRIPKEYILETIREEFKKVNIVEFKVEGYDFFNNPDAKVIIIKINFDKETKKIREKILKKLRKKVVVENKYEDEGFNPHIALGFTTNVRNAKKIVKYLNDKYPLELRQIFDRVSILNGNNILWEYDIFNKRVLTRRESLKHNKRLGNIKRIIEIKNSQE